MKLSHLLLLCVLAKSGIIRLVEGLSTSSLINIRSAQRFSSLGCCLLADTLVQKYLPAPPVSFRMYKQGYSESLMLLTQRCVIGSSSSQLYLLANIHVILKMHSTIRNGTTLLIPRRICWNAMYFFPWYLPTRRIPYISSRIPKMRKKRQGKKKTIYFIVFMVLLLKNIV